MKHVSKLLVVVVTVFLLMALGGCSEKEDESPESAVPEPNSSPQISSEDTPTPPDETGTAPVEAGDASLSEAVALWNAGRKDDATKRFLSLDWQDASTLREMPLLTMSEEQFMALPENERQRHMQETMTLLGPIRKLFFHMASEAERLAGSGNRTEAEQYLGAVRRYGSSLFGGDYIEIVRMHGKAAMGYAEKKLSELK